MYGEADVSVGIRNSLQAFGFGKSIGGKKNYLFGALPIADAFMAWSNAIEVSEANRLKGSPPNLIVMHLISLMLLFLLGGMIVRLLRRKNPRRTA